MSQIQAVKIGNVVNISLDGKLHKKNCGSPEMARVLYKLVLEAKENPSDETLNKIYGFLNEKTRIAMECGLETDPANGIAYLAGFNTPVPQTLIEVIQDYHENKYSLKPVINFWKLLMINPDKRNRESLFDFIKTHDFVLTDEGYMLVYKVVYYKQKADNDLPEFISNSYLHVKKNWKCSGNKYIVYRTLEDEKLHITKAVTAEKWDVKEKNVEILGKLGDMFKSLDKYIEDSETIYTDMHTQKMEIKLGVPVKMPRKECDSDPAIDCSYGLHVGATNYVEKFGSWHNATDKAVLVCLVNPANVVAVPNYDHSKMRVSEYFPMALATYNDGEIDIVGQKYFQSDYTTIEKTELTKMIKAVMNDEKPIEPAKKADEDDRDLDELQKIIETRLVDIA